MGDRLRIVIADDDEQVRECLRRSLVQLGHDVTAVAGGGALVGACCGSPPDLVISDVGMPDLDGITAAEAIRSAAGVPVILVSGSWGREQTDRAEAAGVARCLTKPVRPLELIAAVETVHAARRRRPPPAPLADPLFRAFAEAAEAYAVLTADPAGRITHWNRGAELLLGLADGDAGRPWADTFPADDARDGVPQRDLNAARSGPVERQRWCRRRDGSLVWALVTVEPVRKPGGPIRGFGVVMRDWTEFKERAELIVARGIALWDVEERRSALLDAAAGELRGQVAALAAHARSLRAGADPADAGARLLRHLGQLSGVIDDLLDVGQVCRGKVRLARRRIDARDCVARAVRAARPVLDAAGHRLDVSAPPEPLWLDADPDRLNHVLVNLLTNAAKFTPHGGRVGVAAEQDGCEVVLRVRDSGVGIAPERLATVFYIDSQSTTQAPGDLGIGLAVVRELVALHGGTVRAVSAGEGQGSEFVVRLPAAGDRGDQ
jgi:PAS domain S-box-containing protein